MQLVFIYEKSSDHAFAGRKLERDNYQLSDCETLVTPNPNGYNYFDGKKWVDSLVTVYDEHGITKRCPIGYQLRENESFDAPKPKPQPIKPTMTQKLIMQQQASIAQLEKTGKDQTASITQLRQVVMSQQAKIAALQKEGAVE